jgi:hypothetical protein
MEIQIETKTERILESIYFYMKNTNNFENFKNMIKCPKP